MKDVNFRIYPITDSDAKEMVESLKGFPMLKGVRGERGINLETVTDTLQRLSKLVGDFPCIAEMDINPYMAFPDPDQCLALDARMALHKPDSPLMKALVKSVAKPQKKS
jgi:acetyltransferase